MMPNKFPIPKLILLVIGALAVAGCGRGPVDGRPTPVPASGTIIYKSKPVDGAKVVFAPQDHAHAAVGQTDAQGRFTLQTFEPGDGAVVGKYKVVVSKFEVVDLPGGGFKETFFLPQRYRDPEQSGLEATVPEGGTDQIAIELND
jgi:hypothetical protein